MNITTQLYIVDQPSRARSPWQPTVDGVLVATDTFTAELHFTAVERFKFWPQAVLHTQWPGMCGLNLESTLTVCK
jgi:hypothetical protein